MTNPDDKPENQESRRVAELTERVTELEISLTYQRQTTNTLDEIVRDLFDRIELLKAQINSLEQDSGAGEM